MQNRWKEMKRLKFLIGNIQKYILKEVILIKKYKFILLPILIAFLLTLLLEIAQKNELSFYLVGAPYFIDEIIIKSGKYVSYITLFYFVILFSILGYALTINLSIYCKVLIVFLLFLGHGLLVYLGAKILFGGFFEGLKAISEKGISIK